ncbi:MAG: DUF2889 domain-containing protein [Acidisphaera sp.]|nr:DUF2889 domain-containing protein [Acidisphaera sp.]
MPLSPPQNRELLHSRDIALRGYLRTDGLVDVEAHLIDTKTYGFDGDDRGRVSAGEPIHDMWLRMTVDEDMTIVACEAATDHSPYAVCPAAAPNFASLAGITIKPGFLREAAQRVGGTRGCTHLRELLQQVATVAFQTLYPVRERRGSEHKPGNRPALLNSCLAYGSDSPVVLRRWPEFFTGRSEEAAKQS